MKRPKVEEDKVLEELKEGHCVRRTEPDGQHGGKWGHEGKDCSIPLAPSPPFFPTLSCAQSPL